MLNEKLLRLSKRLYPKGRAFNVPVGGYLETLHKALGLSEARAYEDAKSFLSSMLPDTNAFTVKDCRQWEVRLGLITNDDLDIEVRKLAIRRKMAFPGNNPARQNWRWLQKQLRDAGFDVYVYENKFPTYPTGWTTKLPEEIYDPVEFDYIDHGEMEHGDLNHGPYYTNIIANSITQEGDRGFDPGDNFRGTFFIGGSTLGSIASVEAGREMEFRQLILRTKPAQVIGFLFVNYI